MSNRYQGVRIGDPVTARQLNEALTNLTVSLQVNPPTATSTVLGANYTTTRPAAGKSAYNTSAVSGSSPPVSVPMRLAIPLLDLEYGAPKIRVLANPIRCQTWGRDALPADLQNRIHQVMLRLYDDNDYTVPIVYYSTAEAALAAYTMPRPSGISSGVEIEYADNCYIELGVSIAGEDDWCTPSITAIYDYSDFVWRG